MPVNSVFKRFLNTLPATGSGVFIIMLAIFFLISSFAEPPDRDLRSKQVNLIIRQIGHRLLLQSGDSTSRVLPVTEIREGTFLLGFENEFLFFNHDSLMALSHAWLPKTQFASGYTVTVHECVKAAIVYGFQVSNTSPDILACTGRSQPPGCYRIEFTFPDLYANTAPKNTKAEKVPLEKADVSQSEKLTSFHAHPSQEANLKLEESKVDARDVNPIPMSIGTDGSKTTRVDYPFITMVYSGMLLLLVVTLLITRYRRSLPANSQQAVFKEPLPELPVLGKFSFDVKNQCLLLGGDVVSLTDKECSILKLLNKNFGDLVPRDTLIQEVWTNEGVITGRSLDMFVSRLRKKLSTDPELRITNVHGKGYKLEVAEMQIS